MEYHPAMHLWIAALLLLTAPADARRRKAADAVQDELENPRDPAANASEIPVLARLLERTGWTPTPELSGAFQAGFIFQVDGASHRLQVEDCFTQEPTRSTYTSAEVVTQLQAGVSVAVAGGAGSVGGSGGILKKVKFGTPEHIAMPALKMIPTDACRDILLDAASAGLDLTQLYAVQEVLTAEIAEQTCGRIDAEGRFIGLGSAEVELSMACSQASLEPVAVAFRVTPVVELAGIRDAFGADAPAIAASDAPASDAPAVVSGEASSALTPADQAATDQAATDQAAMSADLREQVLGSLSELLINDTEDSTEDSTDDSTDMSSESLYASLTFARDTDRDGINDPDDACPEAPGGPPFGCSGFVFQPTRVGSVALIDGRLVLQEPITFEAGEARVRSESFFVLDNVAALLKHNADIHRVAIGVHTDSAGASDDNMRLSQDRAEAIHRYLVDIGVAPEALTATGYGEERPIASNETSAGRAQNQRTELTVLD